jgi:hypothetical protein
MINQLQIFADEYGVKREDLRGRRFGSLLRFEHNQGMFMIVTGNNAVLVRPLKV